MANTKEQKRYHFTYKTTNLINNRYYLGMHSTNRLDDGYLGSGKRLYYELKKYGRDNFKFEILEYFDSRKRLVQAEMKLITEQDLENPNCLNMSVGGTGGIHNREHYRAFAKGTNKNLTAWHEKLKQLRQDPEWVKQKGIRIADALKKVQHDHATFKGKKHTPQSINKIKASRVGQGRGNNNSQYGTCWITNEKESKKINRGDVIPEGRLGRNTTTKR